MVNHLMANPAFGLMITFAGYMLGMFIYEKTKLTILPPILTGAIAIIILLKVIGIPYDNYAEQNHILQFMLPITAIVLAVPVYRNWSTVKKYMLPLLAGIITGTIATIGCIVGFGRIFKLDLTILFSMIPKSATNPIAIGVSPIIGGISEITIIFVVIAGIAGAALASSILTLFRVKDEVARGVAIGTISHAIGTSRAFEEGPITGSMSSLAMAIAGMLTAFLSPLVVYLFF